MSKRPDRETFVMPFSITATSSFIGSLQPANVEFTRLFRHDEASASATRLSPTPSARRDPLSSSSEGLRSALLWPTSLASQNNTPPGWLCVSAREKPSNPEPKYRH